MFVCLSVHILSWPLLFTHWLDLDNIFHNYYPWPKVCHDLDSRILYTEKISSHFIFALFAFWFEGKFKTGPIEIYIKVVLCNKTGEWANSRLGKSVSGPKRVKIILGEFKAVYSIHVACWRLVYVHSFGVSWSPSVDQHIYNVCVITEMTEIYSCWVNK